MLSICIARNVKQNSNIVEFAVNIVPYVAFTIANALLFETHISKSSSHILQN